MLGTWLPSAHWSTDRVRFFLARSLALVALFLNDELVLPSLLGMGLLLLNLDLELIWRLLCICESSKFLLRLVRSKLRIGVPLRQDCWNRDAAAYGVNFALCDQLVGSYGLLVGHHPIHLVTVLTEAPLPSVNRIFILTVLLVNQVHTTWSKWVSMVKRARCIDTIRDLGATSVSLAVESLELGFVLDKAILAVLLDYSSIIQHDHASSITFSFWFWIH